MSTLNIGGASLSADGAGNWTSAPAGSIVQIKTNRFLTPTNTTSTSFVPSTIVYK